MQLNFEQLFIEKYLPNFVKPTQKICTFAASKKGRAELDFPPNLKP